MTAVHVADAGHDEGRRSGAAASSDDDEVGQNRACSDNAADHLPETEAVIRVVEAEEEREYPERESGNQLDVCPAELVLAVIDPLPPKARRSGDEKRGRENRHGTREPQARHERNACDHSRMMPATDVARRGQFGRSGALVPRSFVRAMCSFRRDVSCGEVRFLKPMRISSIALASLIALAACGGARSARTPRTTSTTRSVAPSTQLRSFPADPSQLVLRAGDYPTGTLDSQGRADLFDEAPSPFSKTLKAAGLVPGQGAFTRSFHISETYYGSIDSLAVVVASPRLASDFLRDGARGLLMFDGFAGGTTAGTPIAPPVGLGSQAVAFEGPGLNGGSTLAVVWARNSSVGLLIVDRAHGDPRPELDQLSHIMDQRMTEQA